MLEMVFQQIAVKVAIGFFSYIKIFENTVFDYVTEVPNRNKDLFSDARSF